MKPTTLTSENRLISWMTRQPWHILLSALVVAGVAAYSIGTGRYIMGGDAILPGLNPDAALSHLN